MEVDSHIRPGDVYEYSCGNDQGYGYMVPVKTSEGWDFIDTYHLNAPWHENGETSTEASVRQVVELGNAEHDGYVRRQVSNFYYHNVLYGAQEKPSRLRLLFNLGDYDVAYRRECENYNKADVIIDVPLYCEQNFNWASGRTCGLCFVRKGVKRSPVNEFRSLLHEASGSITDPYANRASSLLGEIEKKLHEIKSAGLSTPQDELNFAFLVRRTDIINKCVEDLREVSKDYLARLRIFDNMNGEGTENDV